MVSDMFFSLWTNGYPEQVRLRQRPRARAKADSASLRSGQTTSCRSTSRVGKWDGRVGLMLISGPSSTPTSCVPFTVASSRTPLAYPTLDLSRSSPPSAPCTTSSSSPHLTSAPLPSPSVRRQPNPTPAPLAPTTPASSPPRSLPSLRPRRSLLSNPSRVVGGWRGGCRACWGGARGRKGRRRRWYLVSIRGRLSMCMNMSGDGMRSRGWRRRVLAEAGRELWRRGRWGQVRLLSGVGPVMSGGLIMEVGTWRWMAKGWRRAGRAGGVGLRRDLLISSLTEADHSSRPTAPDANDHFGLTLITPRLVRSITLIGSADLGNVVASEHAPVAGAESWQLYTVREDGSGGWVRLSLCSHAPLQLADRPIFSPPSIGTSAFPHPRALPQTRRARPCLRHLRARAAVPKAGQLADRGGGEGGRGGDS